MTPRRKVEEEDEEIEEIFEEEDEPKKTGGRSPAPPRMSLTLSPDTRKKIRLASAIADMEPNDWARTVITVAAAQTVKKHLPDLA